MIRLQLVLLPSGDPSAARCLHEMTIANVGGTDLVAVMPSRLAGRPIGTVKHRRAQGALVLAQRAIDLARKVGAKSLPRCIRLELTAGTILRYPRLRADRKTYDADFRATPSTAREADRLGASVRRAGDAVSAALRLEFPVLRQLPSLCMGVRAPHQATRSWRSRWPIDREPDGGRD